MMTIRSAFRSSERRVNFLTSFWESKTIAPADEILRLELCRTTDSLVRRLNPLGQWLLLITLFISHDRLATLLYLRPDPPHPAKPQLHPSIPPVSTKHPP